MDIVYQPIGTIHSPFKDLAGMPIQPSGAKEIRGTISLLPQYEPGLKDLEGFSHLILIFHLHRSQDFNLQPIPFMDTQPRGLFATRAPKRPNPIGLSIVELLKIEQNILHVAHLDILDQTPLLDIKPYVPAFDHHPQARIGWLEHAREKVATKRSDDRFK